MIMCFFMYKCLYVWVNITKCECVIVADDDGDENKYVVF